jgi:hypothetical protein
MPSCKPGTFSKGDPRINKAGNLNKEAASWEIRFRNHLARKLPPEKAAEVIIKAYNRGQAWAVDEVNSRLMGKVSQPLEHSGKVDGKLTIEVVKT